MNDIKFSKINKILQDARRGKLFVLVDEPKATGNIRGRTPGFNAVPLTKEIIMEIAPLLGQKSINKTEL